MRFNYHYLAHISSPLLSESTLINNGRVAVDWKKCNPHYVRAKRLWQKQSQAFYTPLIDTFDLTFFF